MRYGKLYLISIDWFITTNTNVPMRCLSRAIVLNQGLWFAKTSLHWRHNGLDGVSDHQPHDCLLTCLFRHISKKTSKLRDVIMWSEMWSISGRLLGHLRGASTPQENETRLTPQSWEMPQLRGQRPISGRTYFRHISLGANFMQLWFFVLNRFLM